MKAKIRKQFRTYKEKGYKQFEKLTENLYRRIETGGLYHKNWIEVKNELV